MLSIILLANLMFSKVHSNISNEKSPEGYYAFIESPDAVPPKVRPPPYTHINIDCKNVVNINIVSVSVNNICGDLNKGQIPKNPMGLNILGEPYPFELIRNETLKFFSKTLPVLKADDTLPKIKHIHDDAVTKFDINIKYGKDEARPITKSLKITHDFEYLVLPTNDNPTLIERQRKSRKFCDGGGIFCTIYRAFQGDISHPPTTAAITADRREEIGSIRYEGPPTPCPAKVEYVTPVFSKNYQGTWRYVVQIPYEGYFTQTVEVTRCLQTRCHYLDGGCLSSPRWVSLLVAEIFYPNEDEMSTTIAAPPVQDFQAYQQYLQNRAGIAVASDDTNNFKSTQPISGIDQHCDGHDELGCFQVRLYYDWFLIPGSCKCWRPDYFTKYVRRKSATDL